MLHRPGAQDAARRQRAERPLPPVQHAHLAPAHREYGDGPLRESAFAVLVDQFHALPDILFDVDRHGDSSFESKTVAKSITEHLFLS